MRTTVIFRLELGFVASALLAAACGNANTLDANSDPEAAALPRFGLVSLESNFPSIGRDVPALADAFFWRADEGSAGCELVQELGPCQVSECAALRGHAADGDFAWLSGGDVDIIGTTQSFSFNEMAPGWYAPTLPDLDAPLWRGGETVTAAVRGSTEFPHLSVSLRAPSPVSLKSPLVSAPKAVDPHADLEFVWSSPDVDSVYVDVDEERAGPVEPRAVRSARCIFPAAAGNGTIAAAVFEALSSPESLSGYRFHVSTNAEAELVAGGATFTLSAWSQSFDWSAPLP
jgi:hypothetical protein